MPKKTKVKKEKKQQPKQKQKTQPTPTTIKGKFVGSEVGYGFVIPEGPKTEDVFIPPSSTWGAIHGDEVVCRVIPQKQPELQVISKKGRRTPKAQRQQNATAQKTPKQQEGNRKSGEILEITHRKPLIGTYFTTGQEGYIRPRENKIPHIFTVPPKSQNRFGLADGHRVIFNAPKPKGIGDRRTPYKQRHTLPCQVTEVLGHIHDPGIDVLTLVRKYNIPHEFPEEVLAQAAMYEDEINPSDLKNRRDLRSLLTMTIDGEDTKDIDDAISFEKLPTGHYQLGVHIADVSHYVKEDTPIDNEALNRGTSVYLADRVIPMLPHRLSSGICSLFPNVDRLTLSCIMTVDSQGNVTDYEVTPSVINSKKRWTYQEVQAMLDGETDELEADDTPAWQTLFQDMNQLRETLYQKRRGRGALDFDLPEAKIRVDETGRPISVEPYQRNQATGIIEELMILCNETIAAHAIKKDTELIFRTHEAPSPEKLTQLKATVQNHGLTLPHVSGPKALQRMLEAAAESPAYHTIAMAALTSLPQAYYTPGSPKHYGLASDAYCHFTSPIRRYADLQVHRIIKKLWEGEAPQDMALELIASQCSRTEREAESLEREVAQLKKVQFMSGLEDRVFEGRISGITPWGAYAMLANTIEGLIPSPALKRMGYAHDKERNRYANKRSRTLLSMGDAVKVRLVEANEDEGRITFALQEK
ncbi:MAG: ribonuclease R [Defluviitaleaceae bacterium]|nr:ribonuclease R [Defluviitaleaceae bacterium]